MLALFQSNISSLEIRSNEKRLEQCFDLAFVWLPQPFVVSRKAHSGNLFWQSGRRPQPHCVGWVTDRLLKSHTLFCTCPFGWRQMVRVPLCVDASPRSLARGAVELDLLLDSLKPESTLEPGSEQSTPSCPAAYCSSSYW
ncbi:hypothetical protein L207DRAFT_512839 [Hyaloscypha variabilis F]|uniref:Uncharacterized protein n=1 Tax=Hyaloscypha variabilis (strain UAMH 11265 / GT02V1 / F) TaxID=1149755 RepID=A0A2J6RN02_HYAVF|nr:hypothetical protein L207DRAFT_512839 [Hyaloscypha variabilis F]